MKTIVLAFVLLHAPLALPQTRNGIVTGRVLTADGKAAASVAVGLAPAPEINLPGMAAATTVVTAQTDADGRYRLLNIPFGRYILVAGAADVATYYPGLRIPFGASVFTIATDSIVSAADLLLARAGTATVSGRVTPAPGRVAAELKALRVAIVPSGYPPQTLEAPVQADGSFRFSKVPPGPYITRVLPGSASVQSLDNPYPTHGIFVEDKDIPGIELEGPVSVVARVVVEGGGKLPVPPPQLAAAAANPADALTSVRLEARSAALGSATATGPNVSPVATAQIRSNGTALLFVPPGEYRMTLAGLPVGGVAKSMVYGNIDLLRDPARVGTATASEILLTVSIPSALGATVRGRITGLPPGGIPSGVTVNAQGAGAVPVAPDGTFEVRGIPAGDRDIALARAGASYLSGQVATSGLARTRITVADKDVNNVELPWLPLAAVSAQASLIDKAGSPMSGIPTGTTLLIASRDGQPIAGGCDYTGCRNDIVNINLAGAAPNYSILLPPGLFDVRVDKLPAGYSVQSLKSAGMDLLKSPLKIERDTPSAAFEVSLQNTSGATVSGKVITTSAAPLLPQRVTIRGTTGQAFTAQARVDASGAFEFPGISPGAYTLQANPDGSPLAWGSTTSNIVANDRDLSGVPVAGLSDIQLAHTSQYASEAAAVLNMQAIQRAESRYSSAFGKLGSLAELIVAGLLDARYSGAISGYTISVTPATFTTQQGVLNAEVTMIASPASETEGRYVFFGGRNGTLWYEKASGPAPGAAAIGRDARGQMMYADGRALGRVATCGGDVPVCLRFDQAVGVQTPEKPGRVTVVTDGANPQPAGVPSNVFVGFISSNGGGNFAGVRSDGSFRVAMPSGEGHLVIQNLPAGYSVKSATAGSTDLLRGPMMAGNAGSIEVTLNIGRRDDGGLNGE